MGVSAFAEMKATGLKTEIIVAYIDALQKKGILEAKEAESFKGNVKEILGETK